MEEGVMVQDSAHTYKIIELVGSSPDGIEPAVQNAIAKASETLRSLDWFEVREIRGRVEGGSVGWYQVKLGVGFRVEDGGQMQV
jgi:flavin-binding protein dodecin